MNLPNRRKLISVPLLITGLGVILGTFRAEAALLKDIRIGEHQDFTRIVFELDTPGNTPQIHPQSSGVLAVDFDGTQPNLKRKIALERSTHVKELKFWLRQSRLSAIFRFDFDHFRFETFPLKNPPRIVLDIYRLAARPTLAAEPATVTDAPAAADSAPPAAGDAEPDTLAEASISQKVPAVSPDVPVVPSFALPAPGPESDMRHPAPEKSAPAHSTELPAYVEPEKQVARAQPNSNGLQFYLVITLVVITIVILALLLFMLLARHGWADGKDAPNVNEDLKLQDQRIAALNARIQQQFKRYEEA